MNTSMDQSAGRMPFQQAGIRVEKLDEFEQLRSAMTRIFASADVEKFLRLLQRKNVPIRDFHRLLREKLLEQSDAKLARGGKSAQQLYDALPVSDQAQMREFYLTTLESVEAGLRNKFNKLYRYY
ncbi:MAG TPA: hypothetical protein VGG15_01935 [Terriglobales bacterium]